MKKSLIVVLLVLVVAFAATTCYAYGESHTPSWQTVFQDTYETDQIDVRSITYVIPTAVDSRGNVYYYVTKVNSNGKILTCAKFIDLDAHEIFIISDPPRAFRLIESADEKREYQKVKEIVSNWH